MYSNQNNIRALKLFLELVLNNNNNSIINNDNDIVSFCPFEISYYEYKCDNCLSIGKCMDNSSCHSESTRCSDTTCDLCAIKCCQSKRFVRCIPVFITPKCKKNQRNLCIKCASVDDLQSQISEREIICVNDYYKDERDSIFDLLCVLWMKDRQNYDNIIQKLKMLLDLAKQLAQLMSTIVQTNKPINFDKINVFRNKQLLTDLAFVMATQFTEFMSYFDSENIRKLYGQTECIVPFNWLVYVMYTLFQNAFSDAVTDNCGKITMESIVHIENTIVKTNNILARSIEGIVRAVKTRK